MKRFKFYLIWVLVSVVLSCAGESDETKKYKLISPEQKTFTLDVQVVGDVEAQKQTYMAPFFSSKLEKLAEDGELVKKDAVIAKLESKDLEDDLSEEELSLGVTRNELVELKKNASADAIKRKATIQLASKQVEIKQLEYQQFLQGAKAEDINRLRMSFHLAKKDMTLARQELKLKKNLLEKGIIPQIQVLQQELIVTEKEKAFQLAQQELKIKQEGFTELDKQIAKLELQRANNTLQIAQANRRFLNQISQLRQKKLGAKIARKSTKRKELERKIASTTLKAPTAGMVVISKIWSSKGLAKVKVGDNVRKGRAFLSVADISKVLIKTEVEEQYISQLKVNLGCQLKIKSLKDKVFQGKISKIGVLAKEKKGRRATRGLSKVFEIEIVLNQHDAAFKPGTSVEVVIPLQTIEKALVVSNKAIYKEGHKNYVYMDSGDKRYIELGVSNLRESVINSGLTLQEKIRLEEESTL